MNNLAIFQYTDREIRFFPIENSFEVAAVDIAEILEYQQAKDLISLADEEYKGFAISETLGGKQKLITLKEPGLYQVLARSNKPKAKPFQRWLFEEALPEIRRTGSYGKQPKSSIRDINLLFREMRGVVDPIKVEAARLEAISNQLTIPEAAKLAKSLLEQQIEQKKTNMSQSIGKRIVQIAEKHGDWISAREISRCLTRNYRCSAPGIRNIFLDLVEQGEGEVSGEGKFLRFRVKPNFRFLS